ncbi:LacI family DNA-binding transcriptional regulator [Olivibacter sp. SDN3]|uniref:LacI family DNA-binding transcriptional regulator n=1 Tax=Olivibacter sp. SDN3 TaxID=2764720 RepID=UPI00165150D2|nr:LacI family DNA-binding transcriptional regulator [Olivibacter sp. SDN3]QNL49324.1 LacI family DNA-binding transcriptional regulator [Olivibacter sp. SDN3]
MITNKNKEVTIYDIAAALNISPTTVSRGLKNNPAIKKSTRKKIAETAKSMGYRSNAVASSLRTNRTNTIGAIVPRLNSHFMSDTIAGIEKVINDAGFNLIISQSQEMVDKEIKNANTMFNNRVDGLLVSLAYDTESIQHFDQFLKKQIPVIFFDRIFDHPNFPNIVLDNYRAGYEATKHLIDQGCKKLVHITANLSKNVYQDRWKGFRDALKDHDLPYSDDSLLLNGLSQEDGIQAAHQIINRKEIPDGVFVSNDNCASSCMHELKQHGLHIPNDIAFVGFNNDPVSKVIEPTLSSINYMGFQMGELAAKTLINHLYNNQPISLTHSIVLRHELIVRDSSLKNNNK